MSVDGQRDAHIGVAQRLTDHFHGDAPTQEQRGGEDEWQGLEECHRDEPDGRERDTIAIGGRR